KVQRALELRHRDDAGHDVGGVVAPGDAEPRREADLYFGHIGDQHRNAALLGQHDIADIFQRSHKAETTDIDRLFAHRDRPAADIGVIGGDRVDDLRYRNAEGPHASEVDLGLNSLVLPPSTSTSDTPGTMRSLRSTTQSCSVLSCITSISGGPLSS